MREVLEIYGGTEWCADPCAVLMDPSYYDQYRKEADEVFEAHPDIDMIKFACVADVSLFLDTTTDFDMHVVWESDDGEMLYVREEWECTWKFDGYHVTRYGGWLRWYNRHGQESLECPLDRSKP